MDPFALPPSMDCAPEFCLCGRKTVESHEFWFCSTECARLDSLRSLDNPECHYRNVVQTYVRTGAVPRRMTSADHIRFEQRTFMDPPPRTTSTARTANVTGFPTLAQVTDRMLTKKASAGELLAAGRHDRPRWEGFPNAMSRARIAQRPEDHALKQISLDAVPFPDGVPPRTLRRVPSLFDDLRNNTRKPSVATRLKFGRSQKAKEGENTERIFGHSVNHIVLPARKESLPSRGQVDPPSNATKALRRSASFSGWNTTSPSHIGPPIEQESVMHIIEEMREELSENFDPRSLFNQEEDY